VSDFETVIVLSCHLFWNNIYINPQVPLCCIIALQPFQYFPKNIYKRERPHSTCPRNCIAEMKNFDEWKPFLVMIAIDFCLTMVNILLKQVLQKGMNHLVFVTYRLSVSTIFLAPISYFKER